MQNDLKEDELFDAVIDLIKNNKNTWYKESKYANKYIAYHGSYTLILNDFNLIIENSCDEQNKIILLKMQNEEKFKEIYKLVTDSEEDGLKKFKDNFIKYVKDITK